MLKLAKRPGKIKIYCKKRRRLILQIGLIG